MRILLYGINFLPELIGTGKYTGEMASWLADHGYEVRVVTAPPYYPDWHVHAGYLAWRYYKEDFLSPQGNKIKVWRCPLWVPRSPSGIKRLIHLASFMFTSITIMFSQIFWQPNIVFLVAPTLFCAPVAWVTAKFSRAKAWLHIQDFELDAAVGLKLLQYNGLRKAAEFFETRSLRSFDRVSTISEKMVDRLYDKGISKERCILFPNWVDAQKIYPLSYPSPYRKELNISPDKIIMLYSGTMGEKQGLEILIEAACKLQNYPEILFILAGTGSARSRLEKQSKGLLNILWLPLQPTERLNDWLNLADIHILPQQADAADLVMPSKLTGMLASGRPIIATALSETQVGKVVSFCGKLVAPGDTKGLITTIQKLAKDPQLQLKLGSTARDYAVNYLGYEQVLVNLEKNLSF
ncbi:putative glycosyl transferase [Candidatus Nitrosacidococcus tergens]|uniref:Putative glycosyl transferase n=2 Tax=Candidatus Nitrosacidococcus tergens TaxID=553981 RepID=A0A7G1Q9B2_9GAMM|nr:putative glycosyl transferase [Candidatus Nitrosacidococcus tergens]